DDIEQEIREQNFIDLASYQVKVDAEEVLHFFRHSSLLEQVGLKEVIHGLRFNDNKLIFHETEPNAYLASVIAAFIRNKLIQNKKSFTTETVMSFPDKVELLREAQHIGYRTYLYYIATEDPRINISRIRYRIEAGGHSVPEDKIISRYQRSLDLLFEAIR